MDKIDGLLVSTTVIWNPGDDFIRAGCYHIMKCAGHYPRRTILFDRNERIDKTAHATCNAQSNAFSKSGTPNGIDAALIAGTPDWGKSNARLYRMARISGKSILMLGLGGHSKEHLDQHICDATKYAIKAAHVVTARDELAAEVLSTIRGRKVPLVPCPALFAPFHYNAIHDEKPLKVAVITSDVRHVCENALNQAAELGADLICHSEFERERFGKRGIDVRYHHEPRELMHIICQYEHIISGRLHGAIPAIGAGCKVVMVDGVDERCIRGFEGARDADIDETLKTYTELIRNGN